MARFSWASIGAMAMAGMLMTGCAGSNQAVRPKAPTRPAASPSTTSPESAPSSTTSPPAGTAPTTTPPAAPDRAIEVFADCTNPTFEPSEIVLTCADYGVRAEYLQWSSWTSTSAVALGTLVYNDCAPDCAQGTFHSIENDQITLTAPVSGASGQLVWSQIQESPEPPGYSTGPFHGGPQGLATRPV